MDKALLSMIENMPAKTGKSLEEWFEVLKGQSFSGHMKAVKHLKEVYGVTHGFANTIVTLSRQEDVTETDLVTEQYKGKENLKPIHDLLLEKISQFGEDITVTPKKTSVSVIRKRQFALIKPATKSRIDLGLKIKDKAIGGRLENSGPFGTMCTHRVRLESVEEVNDELIAWLQEAYDKSV